MAQPHSSTQVLAPHIKLRTLKPSIRNTKPRRHEKPPEKELKVFVHSLRKHLTSGGSKEKRYKDSEVFDCSEALVVGLESQLESGLFGAIRMAYSEHLHLHLRPDDIWLAIAQGVSAHLRYENNAEKYRDVFVDHQGKQEIEVCVDKYRTGDGRFLDWPKCVQLLITELEDRVKGNTAKLLVNDFSTTDFVSKTASQIVLMDAMKHYFKYVMYLSCGIPSVTLHGTLDDWKLLVQKASELRALDIGLDWWLDKLEPVLEKLVDTYQGNVDQEWWGHVIDREGIYGSGGGGMIREDFSGWICAFFPYDESQDRIRPREEMFRGPKICGDSVPKGLVECPFILDNNGHRTDNLLVAGSCGVSVTEDGGVMPCIGWLVKKDIKKDEKPQ